MAMTRIAPGVAAAAGPAVHAAATVVGAVRVCLNPIAHRRYGRRSAMASRRFRLVADRGVGRDGDGLHRRRACGFAEWAERAGAGAADAYRSPRCCAATSPTCRLVQATPSGRIARKAASLRRYFAWALATGLVSHPAPVGRVAGAERSGADCHGVLSPARRAASAARRWHRRRDRGRRRVALLPYAGAGHLDPGAATTPCSNCSTGAACGSPSCAECGPPISSSPRRRWWCGARAAVNAASRCRPQLVAALVAWIGTTEAPRTPCDEQLDLPVPALVRRPPGLGVPSRPPVITRRNRGRAARAVRRARFSCQGVPLRRRQRIGENEGALLGKPERRLVRRPHGRHRAWTEPAGARAPARALQARSLARRRPRRDKLQRRGGRSDAWNRSTSAQCGPASGSRPSSAVSRRAAPRSRPRPPRERSGSMSATTPTTVERTQRIQSCNPRATPGARAARPRARMRRRELGAGHGQAAAGPSGRLAETRHRCGECSGAGALAAAAEDHLVVGVFRTSRFWGGSCTELSCTRRRSCDPGSRADPCGIHCNCTLMPMPTRAALMPGLERCMCFALEISPAHAPKPGVDHWMRSQCQMLHSCS